MKNRCKKKKRFEFPRDATLFKIISIILNKREQAIFLHRTCKSFDISETGFSSPIYVLLYSRVLVPLALPFDEYKVCSHTGFRAHAKQSGKFDAGLHIR